MITKVVLQIDGDEFRVVSYDYIVDREIDHSGRPSSDIRAGRISVVVEFKGNSILNEWAFSPFMKKDGTIRIYSAEDDSIVKSISFEDAYLIDYQDSYSEATESKESIIISARRLRINNVSHDNNWPR